MHHVLSYSGSCLYWCLVNICDGIFDPRIYVTVTPPYPRDRGVTATMLYVLISMHKWIILDFISISLFLLHNPLMGFTTWLGRTSSGPIWIWSPNDLLDPRKIFENLLHHRSNDLHFLVVRRHGVVPIGVKLNILARNHRSLWLFHEVWSWSWG